MPKRRSRAGTAYAGTYAPAGAAVFQVDVDRDGHVSIARFDASELLDGAGRERAAAWLAELISAEHEVAYELLWEGWEI